jgi:hypothetical protein
MDLKSFVKQALTNVIDAVNEAEGESGREIRFTSKDGQNIHFDIAVTAEDSKNAGAGVALQVVKGGINSETKNSTTSRLSFSLFIASQDKEEQNKGMAGRHPIFQKRT